MLRDIRKLFFGKQEDNINIKGSKTMFKNHKKCKVALRKATRCWEFFTRGIGRTPWDIRQC